MANVAQIFAVSVGLTCFIEEYNYHENIFTESPFAEIFRYFWSIYLPSSFIEKFMEATERFKRLNHLFMKWIHFCGTKAKFIAIYGGFFGKGEAYIYNFFYWSRIFNLSPYKNSLWFLVVSDLFHCKVFLPSIQKFFQSLFSIIPNFEFHSLTKLSRNFETNSFFTENLTHPL